MSHCFYDDDDYDYCGGGAGAAAGVGAGDDVHRDRHDDGRDNH